MNPAKPMAAAPDDELMRQLEAQAKQMQVGRVDLGTRAWIQRMI